MENSKPNIILKHPMVKDGKLHNRGHKLYFNENDFSTYNKAMYQRIEDIIAENKDSMYYKEKAGGWYRLMKKVEGGEDEKIMHSREESEVDKELNKLI